MAGGYTSTLTMRLIDGVSAPAKGVKGALGGMDAAARRAAGTRGGAATLMAGGAKALAMIGGGYAVGRTMKSAVTDAAALDRQLERIAITADATSEAGKRAGQSIKQMADDYAVPVDEAIGGLETLVATGRSLDGAMAFLPSVLATAQASGAAVDDIALSADAVGNSFKIAGPQMQLAFDILDKAGKLGKFELKDMAQYLPSLAPAAAAWGYEGTNSLAKLASMLQVVRNQTGSAGEAATALESLLRNMSVDAVASKFKKFGIDIRKELAKAKKEGLDPVEAFIKLSEKAVKGDLSKLPELLGRAETVNAVRALIMQWDEYRRQVAEVKNAQGEVARDLERVARDSQASLDRLKNSWTATMQALGHALDSAGVTGQLNETALLLDRISGLLDAIAQKGLLKGAAEGGSPLLYELFAKTPQSEAYRDAYEKIAGQEAPLSAAKKFSGLPYSLPGWMRGMTQEQLIAEAVAAAKEDAYKAINEEEMKRRMRGPWSGYGIPQRPTTSEDNRFGPTTDFTLGQRGGFTFWPLKGTGGRLSDGGLLPTPPPTPSVENAAPLSDWQPSASQQRIIDIYRNSLMGSGITGTALDQMVKEYGGIFRPSPSPPPAAQPSPPAVQPAPQGNAAPGTVPMPRLRPPMQDLSDAGAETMRSFGDGLKLEMAATEREVDSFVARLRGKLSFTASPHINASVTTSAAPAAAATQATNRAQGQTVAARLRAGHFDTTYA